MVGSLGAAPYLNTDVNYKGLLMELAFLFPGQGSQSPGMLQELALNYPVIRSTFQQASTVLDYDLWDLCHDANSDRLNSTEFTQVAVLAADIALWRLWCELSELRPTLMVGHSLGEYAALVASEAIHFEDAIVLAAARGRLMQQAVSDCDSAMAAIIGCTSDVVDKLCVECAEGQVLSPANYNSEKQIVIAGHGDAVGRALALAKSVGARLAVKLPVSVASHCELMAPAQAPFKKLLSEVELRSPLCEVIHNVGARSYSNVADIKAALVEQLTAPVPWVSIISSMEKRSPCFIECGPGNVLSGLNKRIVPGCHTYQINKPDIIKNTLLAIQEEEL